MPRKQYTLRPSAAPAGRRAAVLAVTLAGVFAALLPGGALAAGGRIPAGFPYAAEVRVTVELDATFERSQTYTSVCGAEAEQSITADEAESETLDRTALFTHLTVPVVPPAALGKAAGRLALSPTATSPGHTTAEHSTYDLHGDQVVQFGNLSCELQHYECPGAITNLGPLDASLLSADDGLDPEAFSVFLDGNEVAEPPSCPTKGATQIPVELGIDASQAYGIPWGSVTLHSVLRPRFYELDDKPSVEFEQPVTGSAPCPEESQTTCTQSIKGKVHVKMKRLFLYRTKRSYAR